MLKRKKIGSRPHTAFDLPASDIYAPAQDAWVLTGAMQSTALWLWATTGV
jgi:hypothetical protein